LQLEKGLAARRQTTREISEMNVENHTAKNNKAGLESGVRLKGFIIPYPPGVPLAVPGDVFTATIHEQIVRLQRAGVEVFFINN
jgi:arginine/lysine/ornithine decarboxylase